MLEQFVKGLNKTRGAFKSRLEGLFTRSEISPDFFEELEEILISADVGLGTTLEIIELFRERLKEEKIKLRDEAQDILKALLVEMMEGEAASGLVSAPSPPTVCLVVGVNGVGKTTAIAKMAHLLKNEGREVLLAAGDTFRAAAIEQLEEWAKTVGADLVKHQAGGDPSAVMYDALNAAVARKVDYLICDTAGRLHTKANLLEEIKKNYRVLGRALEGSPHEVLLVLDATTGHNGIAQARYFQEAVPISGIILTKLDGTARGGVVIAVKQQTGIPVKMVGVGEKKEDLEYFDPHKFVEALFL